MAEILFGKPSVRLSVNKVWRKLTTPEVLTSTYKERKELIAKVKAERGIDFFLKHSNSRMTHGSQRFWDHPVWLIRPVRDPIDSSTNDYPIENIETDIANYKPDAWKKFANLLDDVEVELPE